MPSFYQNLTEFLEINSSNSVELLKLVSFLPRSWKRIGTIAIISLKKQLLPYKYIIGESILELVKNNKIKTVMYNVDYISGEYRKPSLEYLAGEETTITMHIESKTKFLIDISKIMFSAGNHYERLRMLEITPREQKNTIVDMFACVGNLSLIIAKNRPLAKIIGIEKNPEAFKYLKESIKLNKLSNYESILSDNRSKDIVKPFIADRVILGYFVPDIEQIGIALTFLSKNGGILHIHDVIERNGTSEMLKIVETELHTKRPDLTINKHEIIKIKSITKSRIHIVVDCVLIPNICLSN